MNINLQIWLNGAGLSEIQSKIYLAALSAAEGNAQEIAKKAGISKTGVYDHLKNLESLGLIREVTSGKRKRYVALHPKELYKKQRAHTAQLKDLLPDFLSLYAQDSTSPFIQQFEGPHPGRHIYEDILSSGVSEYLYISSPETTYAAINKKFINEWIKRRVKKGIQSRALRVPSENMPADKQYGNSEEYLRHVRYLPSYMNMKATIYVYGNNVGIISAQEEERAYLIYSPDFAATMTSVFDLLWNIGTRTP